MRNKNHTKEINNLYKSNGVGRTIKQRLSHWESQNPDGYSFSHNPTDKQKVAVFEQCWLSEHFPQDYIFC